MRTYFDSILWYYVLVVLEIGYQLGWAIANPILGQAVTYHISRSCISKDIIPEHLGMMQKPGISIVDAWHQRMY